MNKEKRQTKTNRNYKDRVFCILFQDKRNLLSLYNAVNKTDYDNPEELEVITLENAIYLNMRNDVAFMVNSFMNLYEHQSTWNPNMPYRFLQYVASEYEIFICEEALFSPTLVKIPTPQFVVFYNGTKEEPEKQEIKLSDAFKVKQETPQLELKATVYNINAGNNRELMENCQSLKEYSLFVEKVRVALSKEKHKSKTIRNRIVSEVVDECIREGILSDFLRKNKAEVIAMSIFEYDDEKVKAYIREEEFANGLAEGIRQGEEKIMITKVCKKLVKGKTIPEIADALEMDEAEVERICKVAESFAPEYDSQMILEKLRNNCQN